MHLCLRNVCKNFKMCSVSALIHFSFYFCPTKDQNNKMELGERRPMGAFKVDEEPEDDVTDNQFHQSTTSISDISFVNPLMR